MIWWTFPKETPVPGERILVGGYTKPSQSYKGGEWISMTAFYGNFCDQKHNSSCPKDVNPEKMWIVHDFITLNNFDVDWKYWTYITKPA